MACTLHHCVLTEPHHSWQGSVHSETSMTKQLSQSTLQYGLSLSKKTDHLALVSEPHHSWQGSTSMTQINACNNYHRTLCNNWASVSEPHTCDFDATFSLYIILCYIYVTVSEKMWHSAQNMNFQLAVPADSAKPAL